MVVIETSKGNVMLELFENEAPETVMNFLRYVDDKFYDHTIFHRVIRNFMVQGGGFTSDLRPKPTRPPIRNEAKNGLRNDAGTVAMARMANPNSATCQFFINVTDNDGLNYPRPDGYGYAVFGRVAQGMDVVNKIKDVKTEIGQGMRDVPVEPVEILRLRRASIGE